MRIVHTSDWHAGKVWKGRDRLSELQNILEHLAQFVERERIDLLLMTGDVYESAAPSRRGGTGGHHLLQTHRDGGRAGSGDCRQPR